MLSRRTDGTCTGTFRGLPFAEPGEGAWLQARLRTEPWLFALVPAGFEAYARVFHPPYREVGDGEQPSMFAPNHLRGGRDPGMYEMVFLREVRWAEVAAANGRTAHPTMEWAAITGDWAYRYDRASQPGIWDQAPRRGQLALRPTIRLCELLAEHTATPGRCCLGASIIYGDLPDSLRRAPQIAGTHVVRGPLFAIPDTSFDAHDYRGPNLWWPADHAWCVASDYDLQVTHVAGSQRCIQQLVTDHELEALRIDPSRPTTDQINPEPRGTYEG